MKMRTDYHDQFRGEPPKAMLALEKYVHERGLEPLEWTEAVTLVSHTHVPDETYEQVRRHFSEKEILDLTVAVVAINSLNRLAISLRAVPGTYQPKKSSAAAS